MSDIVIIIKRKPKVSESWIQVWGRERILNCDIEPHPTVRDSESVLVCEPAIEADCKSVDNKVKFTVS